MTFYAHAIPHERLNFGAGQIVVVPLLVAVCLTVGWGVHRLIERPLIAWLRAMCGLGK